MLEEKDIPFNLAFAVESTGKSYPEITPHTFAFNNAEGMCPDCSRPWIPVWRQPDAPPGDDGLHSARAFALSLAGQKFETGDSIGSSFFEAEGIDAYTPVAELPAKKLQLLINGSPKTMVRTNRLSLSAGSGSMPSWPRRPGVPPQSCVKPFFPCWKSSPASPAKDRALIPWPAM